MAWYDFLIISGVVALGAGAILYFTPQGRDILAQLQGLVSFESYDPQKTDLFPDGKEPADLRKGMTDFIEGLKKDADFMKGLTGDRPTKLPVINPKTI